MSKGFWPAVSGSVAQSERLDVIANNLANADTNGFKRDQVAFKAVMGSAVAAAGKEEIQRKPYTDKDFHRIDGKDTAYVVLDGTYADFGQGKAKVTGSPLDIAMEGKGFLEVLAPQGVRYTRQGSLKINAEGTLVTTEGYPVLSKGGSGLDATGKPVPREELMARAIQLDLSKPGKLTITTDGKIYQGGKEQSTLSVVEFNDPRKLVKDLSATFKNETPGNLVEEPTGTLVRQGMLETSNVNTIAEMTELLKATRLFESSQKVMQAYGELEGKAVNDLGKL